VTIFKNQKQYNVQELKQVLPEELFLSCFGSKEPLEEVKEDTNK